MPLRSLMTVAVDGFDHGNVFAENAEHWLNGKVMTIVSTNFDLMPNAKLDSVLNVYNLYLIKLKMYFD